MAQPPRRLVILDRDGVINADSEQYIKNPDEWQPIANSIQSIAKLKQHGFVVCIATNQSGIGRKLLTFDDLSQIHNKLNLQLSQYGGYIDSVLFCPHLPEDQCNCRKPLPGMLEAIKKQFPDTYGDTVFIGDSKRDMEAADKAGVKAILVKSGNGAKTLNQVNEITLYEDLHCVVDALIAGEV